jgi:tripartite-type tricarboxylate transporter receptor subunit TctC
MTIKPVRAVLGFTLALALTPAGAQTSPDWPVRPLRIIVVAAAGGLPDIAARNVAAGLQRLLPQPVVVENRAGGAGNIAAEAVAKALPDGHTLLSTGTNQAVNPVLLPNPGFDYERDLTPVALIGESNMMLLSSPRFPARNVRELIALARQKPGGVSMAISVLGSPNHVGAELLATMAGIDLNFVPYKGSGATFPDLMAGNVDLAIAAVPGALGMVKAGKLRALAVTRLRRAPQFPELPTVDESGLPDYEINSWVMLMVTGGTPAPIVERLGLEVRKALALPEVKAALDLQGMESSQMTPVQTGEYLASEMRKWAPVLKTAKMK